MKSQPRFFCWLTLLLLLGRSHPIAYAADWPMFRGGPALVGLAEGVLPAKLSLLWSFSTGRAVKSSPAIEGKRVFFGSADANVYALDLADGKKVWAFSAGQPIESSPLVLDDKVYIGSGDGVLYALEAGTGKLVWKYKTGEKILGGPNWFKMPRGAALPVTGKDAEPRDRTLILVGSYDFKLHCVDARSGEAVWTYESGNYINGSPAISEGRTVFGGCDALLHVISLADGKQEKEVEAGAYIAGSVALENGRAYFGQFENEFLCVDLKEGKQAWSFRDRNFPYFSSPAVAKDRVVFGGRDKLLHCVKKEDGSPLWSFATRGKLDSSPVICGDKVVTGSDDGRVYIISL